MRIAARNTCTISRAGCPLVWLSGIVVGLSLLPGDALAQTSVHGRLKKSLVGLGETIPLEIVVDGSADAKISADIPAVAGLRITGPQSSSMSQTSIINGRVESSVTTTLTYQITAVQDGAFAIPAFPVSVDGTKTSIGPFRLKVERSPESSQIRLKTSLEKTRVFVQEPVVYRVAWYIATDVKDYLLTIPLLDDPGNLNVEVLPADGNGKQGDLVASGTRLPVSITSETMEGVDYAVYTVRLQLYPLDDGTTRLPAPFVRAAIRDGWKVERDFFGFTNRVPKYKTLSTAAEAMTLRVKPLPVEGRPRGFSGAVGSYTISVSADVTEVRVGDPIRLTSTVKGRGLLDMIPRIDLADFSDVVKDFSVVETLEPGEVLSDRVVFEQIVRAKTDTVTAFPAIPFPYFDTRSGQYENAWSKPIVLSVTPAPGLGPLEEYGATARAGRRPSETAEGLRTLYRGNDLLMQAPDPWGSLPWLLAAPGGYLVLLGIVLFRRRLSHESQTWKRRSTILGAGRAFSRVEKLVGEPGDAFFAELADTCTNQVSTRLGIGKGEVTAHDVPKLRDAGFLSSGLAEDLKALLEELDALRYSPDASEQSARAALLERATRVIPRVKKKR